MNSEKNNNPAPYGSDKAEEKNNMLAKSGRHSIKKLGEVPESNNHLFEEIPRPARRLMEIISAVFGGRLYFRNRKRHIIEEESSVGCSKKSVIKEKETIFILERN